MGDMHDRLKNAVAVLKEGGTLKIGDIRLGIYDKKELTVTGWTRYHTLENLSQAQALEELEEIKAIFAEMLNISPELLQFSGTKTAGYYLGQDYGQGATGICKEVDGEVIWEADL